MVRHPHHKRIGVLTSGGDCPGMNACLRAVVRTAIFKSFEVMGIRRGYQGIIEGELVEMDAASVSNILHLGGTILGTARSEEFMSLEGRAKAAKVLEEAGIERLIVIGGDGTFRGAVDFLREKEIALVAIPASIDGGIFGTDATIGFDTALNCALEAIDRIRDTAESHERVFFVEVMGRDIGALALHAGVAGGVEGILIPETPTDLKALARRIKEGRERGKRSSIVVVCEGDEEGGAYEIARRVSGEIGLEHRVCVLGHIQRGGRPTGRDRVLASKLGAAAVEALSEGRKGEMVGEVNGQITFTPLEEAAYKKREFDQSLYQLAQMLST